MKSPLLIGFILKNNCYMPVWSSGDENEISKVINDPDQYKACSLCRNCFYGSPLVMKLKLYPARGLSDQVRNPFLYELNKMVQQIALEVYYDIRSMPNPP